MSVESGWRDYGLTGANADAGFAPGDWYSSPVPRKRMKELMRRQDRAGLTNYAAWLALVALFGIWVWLSWGSVWVMPALLFYGIFYGSCADSRWHECSHGTVFKTSWLNIFFYQVASFMSLKNPYLWRWSHTRHHTDTLVVGRDPEIAFPRPPSLLGMALNLLHLKSGWAEIKKMLRLAIGVLTEDEKDFLIEADRGKAFWMSRVHLAILIAAAGWSVAAESWLPIVMIGTPTFYGTWLHHLLAATQHAGLAEDVPDHRLSSRTVHMNPFFRFVYSNMNYHVEHHMYPMVPFYALPALHEEIKADCPPAYPNTLAAFREMIPAMLKQQKDPLFFVSRRLPVDARPSPKNPHPTAAE